MDSLEKLQRRKAELKAQIALQEAELKKTLLEARDEIEPANLLKKAVGGLLDFSKNKPGEGAASLLKKLPKPLAFVASLIVKDPKLALALNLLSPVVQRFFDKEPTEKIVVSDEKTEKPPEKPLKSKLFGQMRRGVSALRGHLRKTEKPDEQTTEQTEI